MPTVEQRYVAATEYARRAIKVVEAGPAVWDPVSKAIEWYAGRTKTEPVKNDLRRIEQRWLFATSDAERARVARDAESLADRIQEVLPGAPQDRQRTDGNNGAPPTFTPATSYGQEVERQAEHVWTTVKDTANRATEGATSIGKWLLVGGGLLLGIKAVDYLREREQHRAADDGDALNRALERLATRPQARNAGGYLVRKIGTGHLYRVTHDDGGRVVQLVPVLHDGRVIGGEISDEITRYERVCIRRVDGGAT